MSTSSARRLAVYLNHISTYCTLAENCLLAGCSGAGYHFGTVLVTGANRGIGLGLTKALVSHNKVIAVCRKSSPELKTLKCFKVIEGIDVQDEKSLTKLRDELKGDKLDVLINNAGYFYEPEERLLDNTLNYKEEIKMIDICAIGPLRVTAAVKDNLKKGTKVVMITSQGGSISGVEEGKDYGHHMSKAAANMMSRLLSLELKSLNIPVLILHPGFFRTEMTQKYSKIYDKFGATTPEEGVPHILKRIEELTMATSGVFIRGEDGSVIPW